MTFVNVIKKDGIIRKGGLFVFLSQFFASIQKEMTRKGQVSKGRSRIVNRFVLVVFLLKLSRNTKKNNKTELSHVSGRYR